MRTRSNPVLASIIEMIDAKKIVPPRLTGTPKRLHRGNHNDTSPGTSIRGRFVKGRFV
jgi:hypothetical protein